MTSNKFGEGVPIAHLQPSSLFAFFVCDAEWPASVGTGYRLAQDLNLTSEDLKQVKSTLICDIAHIAYDLARDGKLASAQADEAKSYFYARRSPIENRSSFWRVRFWFEKYYRQRWLGVKIWCQVQDILAGRMHGYASGSERLKGLFADIERRRIAWYHLSDFWLDSDLATAWAHQKHSIRACLDLGYTQSQILAIARFELHPVLCCNIWTWDGFDSDDIEAKIALYCLSSARRWFAHSFAKMYKEPIADIEAALKMMTIQ